MKEYRNRPIIKNEPKTINSYTFKDSDEPLVQVSGIDGIFQRPMYYEWGFPHALSSIYLRLGVVERLEKARKKLPKGYAFLLYDGFRPYKVQLYLFQQIYEQMKIIHPYATDEEVHHLTRKYVALPTLNRETPSPHLTGGAVDLTLCNEMGIALPMGTEFDDMSSLSRTDYFESSSEDKGIRNNRRILYHSMTDAGFTNYEEEWWHFDFGNSRWARSCGSDIIYYGLVDYKIF